MLGSPRPTAAVAACWLAAAPLAAQQAGPANLLANGGGESLEAARIGEAGGQPMLDVPGWIAGGGGWCAQAEEWEEVRPRAGQTFLRTTSGDRPVLVQEVPLGELGSLPGALVLSGWLRTARGKDRQQMDVAVFDAFDDVLAEAATGWSADAAWRFRFAVVAVPEEASHAVVSLRVERRDGKLPDGLFDDIRLDAVGRGFPRGVDADRALDRPIPAPPGESYFVLAHAATQAGARGVALLRERCAAEPDAAVRRHLIALALLSPHRDATALHRSLLDSTDKAERAVATELLGFARFDWRRELGGAARDTADPKVLADFLRRLAADGGRSALAELRRIHDGGDEVRRLAVLGALAGSKLEPSAVYRAFVEPHLDRSAKSAPLRRKALEVMARLRDRRFLGHFAAWLERENDFGTRARMIAWAAAFDTVEALKAMIPFVEADLDRVPGAFLAAAPKMQSEAVGTWLRRHGLRHRHPIVREVAVRQMVAWPRPEDLDVHVRAARQGDVDVAVTAVAGIAAVGGEDAVFELRDLCGDPRGRVAAAALRALAAATPGDGDVRALIGAAAAGGATPELRVAAVELLAAAGGDAERAAVLAAMRDSAWNVRAAAYAALAGWRDRAAVETLLARLGEERSGAAREFLLSGLTALTGVDQGAEPEAWTRWWAIVGAEFAVPERRTKPKRAAAGRTATAYYGIPVRTDRLVFVLDLSGSMGAKAGETSRLDEAKARLIAVLEQLDPDRRFDIVTFSTRPEPWQGRLVRATPDQVAAAVRWVERLTIGGHTNVYDSLALALDTKGVDAVFLLSDGGPSIGKFVATAEIRNAIALRNREAKVTIHTIAIGGGAGAKGFMRQLAEENWGAYRDGEAK